MEKDPNCIGIRCYSIEYWTNTNEILEENNYYPFGLKHQGYNSSIGDAASKDAEKYRFNSKEFQSELNLNLHDFGARNYDAAIGRWFNVDPLAEAQPNMTPYRYSFNNPVNYVDPDGLFETRFGAWWNKLWNGSSDASSVKFDDNKNQYYYNDVASGETNGVNIKSIYNRGENDAGRLILEVEGSASVGVQLGVKTSFGRFEGGILTGEIGKIGWSNQEENNNGFHGEWGDGKGHNFAGIGLQLFTGKLGVGTGVDYVTSDITPTGGDVIDYYANNGELFGGVSFGPKALFKTKAGSLTDGLGTSGKIRGRYNTSGNNDYTIDLSFGAKAILGLEGKVRFGFTSKKK